jgi:hypothetical protein
MLQSVSSVSIVTSIRSARHGLVSIIVQDDFLCPFRPSWLSRNALYSVGTGGCLCENYVSNVEVNVISPSSYVVANEWWYTSIAQ